MLCTLQLKSVKTVITKGIGTYGQYPISIAAEYATY